MKLVTEEQLAEDFGLPVEKARDLRQRQNWPHVRLSRFDIRYTEQQIEQIIASRSVTPNSPKKLAAETGLTERSARRSS